VQRRDLRVDLLLLVADVAGGHRHDGEREQENEDEPAGHHEQFRR